MFFGMKIIKIAEDVLMWPSAVAKQLSKGSYIAPAVGLGAGIFLFGLPSAEMDFYEIAQWYVGTGASVVGSSYLINKANNAATPVPRV